MCLEVFLTPLCKMAFLSYSLFYPLLITFLVLICLFFCYPHFLLEVAPQEQEPYIPFPH